MQVTRFGQTQEEDTKETHLSWGLTLSSRLANRFMKHSLMEKSFLDLWRLAKYIRDTSEFYDPVAEFRFHPERRWRFDFAWPGKRVAVELEGGIWIHGAHNRGQGFIEDCEKYNEAQAMGWVVLRFTERHLSKKVSEVVSKNQLATIDLIIRVLKGE